MFFCALLNHSKYCLQSSSVEDAQLLTMRLLIIFSSLLAVQAGVTRRDTCSGPSIDGVNYNKEVLKTNIDRPYLLSTDYSSDTVYFSYSFNPDDDAFKSAKVNLNTKEFTDIGEVPNGFAQSVDQKTHDVYIGGSEGIFKYNLNNNKAEYYAANGTDIWVLFYKDVLYFAEYPSQVLYTIVNGDITRFRDLEDTKVDNFVIDDNDYLFFTNKTGMYSQKKGTKDSVYYENTADLAIRGLTTNKKGDVFACIQDGIYAVHKNDHVLEKKVDINDAFGVTFDDNNNYIYSDATSLVRLVPCNQNSGETMVFPTRFR